MASIDQIGLYFVNLLKMTKYDFDFPIEVVNKNILRLTNQVWKLIPMREKEEDWQRQLDTVLLEIVGLNEIFLQRTEYIQILSKMEGLRKEENLDFHFQI